MRNHPTIDQRLKQEQGGQNPPTTEVPKAKNLLENAHDTALVPKHMEKPRTLY